MIRPTRFGWLCLAAIAFGIWLLLLWWASGGQTQEESRLEEWRGGNKR